MTYEARIRSVLLAILAFGCVSLTAELLLQSHFGSAFQIIPIALLSSSLILIGIHAWKPTGATVRLLRVVMVLMLLAGALGVLLHAQDGAELQRELDPDISTPRLLFKILSAQVPPVLAPGVLVQLALIGLAHVYKHPSQ